MRRSYQILLLVCVFIFSGCSAVRVNTHAAGARPPLLLGSTADKKVLVLWGTAWRSNQKEPARREKIASGAITSFFNSMAGRGSFTVRRSVDGIDALSMSDSQILRSETVVSGKYQKVVVLRVEELGPTLAFYLSPILWAGSSQVVVRIRVLDVAAASLDSDVVLAWEKGGPFVIRGAKYLEGSLSAALASVF